MKLEYKNLENKYETVKDVLKKHFKVSERLYTKLKRYNKISVNGNNSIPYKLRKNDVIIADISFDEINNNIIPVKMNLDIIYEDERTSYNK